ncbi:hypothetical protein SAMN04487950_1652 [Halogranum rubrum]|uniref:Uncharacterized protein n=1 Tax=Halogranum rubrum TaxID=553466 RepID=A0A1I4D7E5_9EURY|nr:hypothetical protein SAMN04487950_1652 [Halogranum rubrum]
MGLSIGTIGMLVLVGIMMLVLLLLVAKGEVERDSEMQADEYNYKL